MTTPCKVMKVSRSAYYAWQKKPAKVITAEQLNLYQKAKHFFVKKQK
ncbi:hypothetical protein Q4493_14755 [Colwellia sp. 1_MG-2023]|nr:hypothetical protein [Colwellia sp. 1_MG-2023]MDO6447028.1 hypothetical protein [Colwellia sp. 1_MG-2023]